MRPRLLHLGYSVRMLKILKGRASFNEAEAFTPRILGSLLANPEMTIEASMRPRLLHLGYTNPA